MKSYGKLKVKVELIQQQIVRTNKSERSNAVQVVKCLFKEFSFTAVTLKNVLNWGAKSESF